ncbi:MAG: single-stranded DNA-binding protein [Polyangiaceae bacterium]|nr:single-stranded DNA-binding protein [Polyangiaceae bacterium]
MDLVRLSRKLCRDVERLTFASPVTHVYNPLRYARAPHESYLQRWGAGRKRVIFLGMNPGPYGMAQTGVPFGEIHHVREFLGIEGPVSRPVPEHPKRPIEGFACTRSEVSGKRLWSYFQSAYGDAETFFRECFVVNYCPLAFMEASGRNRTPDKLPEAERQALFALCDDALRRVVALLEPELVVGVGGFAERRALAALGGGGPRIGTILHPSPANPSANRGWAEAVALSLGKLGVFPGRAG